MGIMLTGEVRQYKDQKSLTLHFIKKGVRTNEEKNQLKVVKIGFMGIKDRRMILTNIYKFEKKC